MISVVLAKAEPPVILGEYLAIVNGPGYIACVFRTLNGDLSYQAIDRVRLIHMAEAEYFASGPDEVITA